ncbi:MAG: glycoside hydrolase family 15 protein [Deltaproteobacteria bacterium]|nr:glycoside hydrolase family 15 protein [Kofleriaceae bacterium]
MDLFSSARRLERPYRFTRNDRSELPLDARALIGDGITCALVRPDGVIDWMCMPRFDSPSVFGALLDPERGGRTAVTPVAETFTSLQAYDPGTNVLETIFQVPGQGVARLIDFMPWSDDPRAGIHEIHRRIECIEGEVELELVFDPRFDYGRDPATLDCGPHGVRARGQQGEQFVAVATRASWQPRAGGGVAQRIRLPARTTHWLVLAWSGADPEPLAHYRSYEHLRATRRAWREWSNRLVYDGPWRHHVMRSALCLKLLTYAPTGAMVAAPTASLPEWIGGGRNWDYRYAWVRDSSFAIRTENLLGYNAEARDFFYFVRDAIDLERGLDVMYAIDGRRVPAEVELAHLAGHKDSRPVRIGNGARDQLQLDTVGALVDAAHLYERFGNSLTLASWRKIRAVIQALRRHVGDPDDGIWEPRSGRRHNVHSKLMSWVALDRGAGLAGAFGEDTLRGELLLEAEALRDEILERGVHPDGDPHFVAAYGEPRVDAALLTMPLYGLIDARDPRMTATVDRIRAELGRGSFLYRYRYDDGVPGDEGAFVLCGFWLAEVLAMMGKVDEAQAVFVDHVNASNHVGLLAEELDPSSRAQLGNFPQAFSHLGLINAAMRIDLALRLRDEGSRDIPHLVTGPHRRPAGK